MRPAKNTKKPNESRCVLTKLKQLTKKPELLNFHCFAHQFHLITGHLIENCIPAWLSKILALASDFQKHPLRHEELESIQISLKMRPRKFLLYNKKHWASFSKALKRLVELWLPLLQYGEKFVQKHPKKSTGWTTLVLNRDKLELIKFFKRIFESLSNSNKHFQTANLDITQTHQFLNSFFWKYAKHVISNCWITRYDAIHSISVSGKHFYSSDKGFSKDVFRNFLVNSKEGIANF